ncbi:large conductance mechanosensitive channel protein MscL [Frigoribacterium faeni]|uniref:Large-conductance mechanosensitive channel n=1 Tax=Frigoribacterium faeni TaxID=145483 RepID=A0A7W3PJB1_9MICO|nr:large conductance mechanosensitive channel protein MscL [Frigoribacterium faeni]MBA8813657.1 large conductance mechanosensitive channel [Frigoribacterium faeni]BFF14942.1 large-conductance mechanosensitive channel protein MscL [Microbacterium flavescens]GEK84671.1 large-conductance mechanosensitive channel [Frigoribacterium faeni]
MKGFKEFILRGNVIDLAVAVVIGAAFTAIVTSLVTNIFNPLIGAAFDAASLDESLVVTIPTLSGKSADLLFGAVIGSAIQFVIIAAVVYFCLVLPVNGLLKRTFARQKAEETPVDVPPTDVELLSEIRDLLRAQNAPVTASGSHAAPVADASDANTANGPLGSR